MISAIFGGGMGMECGSSTWWVRCKVGRLGCLVRQTRWLFGGASSICIEEEAI